MEPLTINQELYNLSLADLKAMFDVITGWDAHYQTGDKKDDALHDLLIQEMRNRIDLIKSKI
jgi:hypothetical protein